MEIEYLTDKNGHPKAVVIPIEVWKQLFPKEDVTLEELSDRLEDYCIGVEVQENKVQMMRVLHRREFYRYLSLILVDNLSSG